MFKRIFEIKELQLKNEYRELNLLREILFELREIKNALIRYRKRN